MNNDLLWSKVLDCIKQEVNAIVFTTWFKNTRIYNINENILTIVVPMNIHKNHLSETYEGLITGTLLKLTNNMYQIKYILQDEITNENTIQNDNSIDLTNLNYSNNNQNIIYKHSSNLNKNYNFENYVVGDSNRLAHATALAVAETPGEIYNPLFIYGSSGLGKTHLMHAIGNYIEENSNKRVLYISSQQFIDDFSKISRKDENNKTNYEYAEYFKNKYRSIDVLIIDDIQYLASTHQTQDEFFHTFNVLHDEKKQIIISSDRSPNDLNKLEERLKTRFCWGLTATINPPEFELRKNILKVWKNSSCVLGVVVINWISSIINTSTDRYLFLKYSAYS